MNINIYCVQCVWICSLFFAFLSRWRIASCYAVDILWCAKKSVYIPDFGVWSNLVFILLIYGICYKYQFTNFVFCFSKTSLLRPTMFTISFLLKHGIQNPGDWKLYGAFIMITSFSLTQALYFITNHDPTHNYCFSNFVLQFIECYML